MSGVPIHGSFSPHPDGRLSNGLSGSSMGGPSNSPSMTSSSQTLPIRHQQPPIGPPHSQTIARGPYGRSASNARKLSTIAAPKEGFVAYGKRCTEFKQLFDLHRRLQPINQPEDLLEADEKPPRNRRPFLMAIIILLICIIGIIGIAVYFILYESEPTTTSNGSGSSSGRK